MTKRKVASKVDTLKLDQFALLDRRLGRIEKAVKKNGAHELLQAIDIKADAAAAAAAAAAVKADETHAKQTQMDASLSMIGGQLKLITDGLFGCEENPDRKGFVERLRDVEGSIAGAGRAIWIAIAALIGVVVTAILGAIR